MLVDADENVVVLLRRRRKGQDSLRITLALANASAYHENVSVSDWRDYSESTKL